MNEGAMHAPPEKCPFTRDVEGKKKKKNIH
jgi:hypothetical protein